MLCYSGSSFRQLSTCTNYNLHQLMHRKFQSQICKQFCFLLMLLIIEDIYPNHFSKIAHSPRTFSKPTAMLYIGRNYFFTTFITFLQSFYIYPLTTYNQASDAPSFINPAELPSSKNRRKSPELSVNSSLYGKIKW